MLAGRHAEAEADLERCLALGDQIGTTFHRGAFQAFRAKLRLLDGEVGEALRHSAEALEVATETAQAWSRSIALRIHAEALIALEPPRIEQAEQRHPQRDRDPGAARMHLRPRLVAARRGPCAGRQGRARARPARPISLAGRMFETWASRAVTSGCAPRSRPWTRAGRHPVRLTDGAAPPGRAAVGPPAVR